MTARCSPDGDAIRAAPLAPRGMVGVHARHQQARVGSPVRTTSNFNLNADGGRMTHHQERYSMRSADHWETEAKRWVAWARAAGHDAYWYYREAFFGIL